MMITYLKRFCLIISILWSFDSLAQGEMFEKIRLEDVWLKVPNSTPAPEFDKDGIKAVYYQGVPLAGKTTRVFAFYGIPKTADGGSVPGMVLIHGGGGTAFEGWVALWNKRGYAAIAMDTCGCIPKGSKPNSRFSNKWEHLPDGGPPGWGGFDQVDSLPGEQWTFHAVSAVIIGHSLLRSLPGVDADRIGITGISWGGYLTCIVAGIDTRLKFAVPVYGCGFLGDNSAWTGKFKEMGDEKSGRWLRWWDPSVYLKDVKLPMLWVTGSNDFAYPFDSLQKSYRLPKGPRTLCIKVRMPHGHGGAGENPEEILAFAENIVNNGKPLVKVTGQGRDGLQVWANFTSEVSVTKAELNFTKDTGKWQQRKWETMPASVDSNARKVTATLPEGAKVYYFNLVDERGFVVSTEHVEVL